MYMYSMNQPPKRPSRWRKLIRAGYGIAGAVAVLMALIGAFTMNSALLSAVSVVYGLALLGALLCKMATEQAEEDVTVVRVVLYALLLLAAVFDIVISWLMPVQSLAGRVVPTLLCMPCAALSVWQLVVNGRRL